MNRLKQQLNTYKPNRTTSNHKEPNKNKNYTISTDWNIKKQQKTCLEFVILNGHGRRRWKVEKNLSGWRHWEWSRHLDGGRLQNEWECRHLNIPKTHKIRQREGEQVSQRTHSISRE